MPILIVPLFISPVIVGQFWALLLQRPFGPTDYLLGQLLGHEVTIAWLTELPWNFIGLDPGRCLAVDAFMFVILLAGLTSIPPEHVRGGARLDGVNAWQAFRYVTLPQLMPMILLALTFRLLDAVKLFDVIFMMTGGGPGTSTYTASFYLYQIGFQHFHLSEATAGSWLFLLLTAAIVSLPGAPAAAPGERLMAAVRRTEPGHGSCDSSSSAVAVVGRARAALLGGGHLDQADRRLSGGAAGLVSRRTRRSCTTSAALFAYRGLEGLIAQPHRVGRRVGIVGAAGHRRWATASRASTRAASTWRSGCCRSGFCRRSPSCCRSSCCIATTG